MILRHLDYYYLLRNKGRFSDLSLDGLERKNVSRSYVSSC